MFNFSVPEGLLGACEPKEAYVSFFLLQDSADPMARGKSTVSGWGQWTRRHQSHSWLAGVGTSSKEQVIICRK